MQNSDVAGAPITQYPYTTTAAVPRAGSIFSVLTDWRFILIAILVLAALGINVFFYLAQGTQEISQVLGPAASFFGTLAATLSTYVVQATTYLTSVVWSILKILGVHAAEATKEVAHTGAQAAQVTAQHVVGTGLDVAQQNASAVQGAIAGAVTHENHENVPTLEPQQPVTMSALDNSLNSAQPFYTDTSGPTYHADNAFSAIQSSKSSSKSGWCYIGEDRGFRSCIEVGDNDQCMSGQIFPSADICSNPSLRP